jgi:hypothetical protein
MRTCALLTLLLFAACKVESDPNEARLMPKPPPPPTVGVPAGFSVKTEIDHRPGAPIDARLLSKTPPDFQDPEHKAWRIARLLALPDGVAGEIAVTGDGGFKLSFKRPLARAELEPVLMLTRRGSVIACEVSPADPFPPYHGQGRRLSRGGDPLPHVPGVNAIEFVRSSSVSKEASP